MTFAVGDTVGPYRIMEQIGQGGMATVYKAYHANLDRYVAFKVLHPAFKEDPGFLERFKREAQIVAKLEHPSIVPIYDYADYQGQPYLVMKFIEGETLKARLRRQPLTLTEAIQILDAVAHALTFAHEQGILHRDIKPSNIMLGLNSVPYIADFGLARIAQAGESTLSQDMMLGTPQYISPEQAKGIQHLGPGTDIYSLGVVLYEVVVGRVPFSADTPFAIVHDHIYKPLPLPSQLNPDVPLEVERVLLKALAKEPGDRYTSAVDMVTAFRQAVETEGMTELSTAHHASSIASPYPAAIPPSAGSPGSTPVFAEGVPSPLSQPVGSSASRRAYRRRANLWILGGVGSLLLICLLSLCIVVSAVSKEELQPWNIDTKVEAEEPAQNPPADPFGSPGDLSTEAAQRIVDERPNDPAAHLQLALAQYQDGDTEAALISVHRAVTELDASSDLVAAAARRAVNDGREELASWLYLEALVNENVNRAVRNEAGAYLYERIRANPLIMRKVLDEFMDRRVKNAPVLTLNALDLLALERPLTRRQAYGIISAALDLDDALAETYLVRGLYYQASGQLENAQADWRYAVSFADAPDWVVREARRLLEESS
jgi:serine/threonine protein kinase